jgi:hypothetical protein
MLARAAPSASASKAIPTLYPRRGMACQPVGEDESGRRKYIPLGGWVNK